MNGVCCDTRRSVVRSERARFRSTKLIVFVAFGLGILLILDMAIDPISVARAQADSKNSPVPSVEASLVDVRIEGNVTIPVSTIAKYIKTRPGRPPSQKEIREDVRALYATRWFFNVEPRLRASEKGTVLIFKVLERPVVQNVEYRGNDKIKTKQLSARTGLKKGSAFDISANRESARKLEDYYHEKGFVFATIKLEKGGHKDDREVIFLIDEGPKVRVTSVKFTGNDAFSSPLLKTKLRTKRAILWKFGGIYDPSTIVDDVVALKQYYHNLGYFDVHIDHELNFSKKRNRLQIEYKIEEGVRYKLRNVEIVGNTIYSNTELQDELELVAGEHFSARKLNKDVDRIKDKYGDRGHLFAQVDAIPRFLEDPGIADLIYRIDEDLPYRIRQINVHIEGTNPHTKRTVVLNPLLIAPGDLANPKLIRKSERRLEGTQLFDRGPGKSPRINVKRVEEDDPDDPLRNIRGQSPDDSTEESAGVELISRAPQAFPPAPATIRGQSRDDPFRPPQNPIYRNSPQGDPFGETDLDVFVTEARTGRLMFGVGVNSDAGLVGSIVLSEQNFDILRPPTSLRDIYNGTAWRGGGQRFRLEAVPGSIVSRYTASWTDPYFLDTRFSLGVSGFFYNRFLPDWDEQRAGGRINVGRQLTQWISITGAFRLEEIELSNPDRPTPTDLTAALGNSFLSTIRLSIAHDTRDAAFLPGEGHIVELSYEQAFGDFSYPRVEANARQFYTLHSRPDGGGRHTLMIAGQVGWTGSDTPIFERFYAGGFQTFRGFNFRGVTPRSLGVGIGGEWMALGTVEYMAPLVAAETIQGVIFTDFGTVEDNIGFDNVRMTVGAGLRVTVPAMGPVPLAFDFAVPVSKDNGDDTRVFSFYVGLNR